MKNQKDAVIFLDWHGVLCTDVFWWKTITEPKNREYHAEILSMRDKIFGQNKTLVKDWMRGKYSSQEVIKQCTNLGAEFEKYALQALIQDCQAMRINTELLQHLKQTRSNTLLVVATENMDCFWQSHASIESLHDYVDHVLCSSEIGVLKAEDPQKFFGEFLRNNNVDIKNAILLDDTKAYCDAFASIGGTGIHFRSTAEAKEILDNVKVLLES